MSLSNEMSPADIAACTGNHSGFGMGGDGAWWIIILFLFAFSGGWGNNGGFGGYGGGYVSDNYTLVSDMGQLERKIDGVYSGICDSTFALNNTITNGFASAQNTMTQGFAGLNTGIVTQGYETRNAITQDTIANMQGFNGLQGAVKDCCCVTQQNIKDGITQGIMNTSALQSAIKDCCCDTEKQFMQTRFDNAQYNCATLQAIDKVGDRIIDYLAKDKAQTLRDENQALRLAASQQAQNNYLVDKLGYRMPIPAYQVPNPYCNCNCNNGCC